MRQSFDLAAAIRRSRNVRRASITLVPIEPTRALAVELATIYAKVLQAWDQAAAGSILPAYEATLAISRPAGVVTDDVGPIEQSLEGASETLTRLVIALSPALSGWALRVERWHRRKFATAVMGGAGVDISPFMGSADDALRLAVARNVSLVKSVSEQTRQRIAEAVWQGYRNGSPPRQVARDMRAATKLARERALRIAADQALKLSAQLDQDRQTEAGITEFRWRHSGKLHPRLHHKARDGKIYSWAKNDLGGDLPGMAPYCGCKAQAYIDLMG